MFELRDINKKFTIGNFRDKKNVYALNDINLTIKDQEILGLVGESGSGKTTIARIIARIYRPTSGKLFFNNIEVPAKMNKKERLSFRKNVQMIFQDPFSSMNPLHNIGYIMSRPFYVHHICDKDEVRDHVIKMLESWIDTRGNNL